MDDLRVTYHVPVPTPEAFITGRGKRRSTQTGPLVLFKSN